MRNPLKKKKTENLTPYTWDEPYTETRKLVRPDFYKKDGDWVTLRFDCSESWDVCLSQYKRLGSPLPGDEFVIRILRKTVKKEVET